jgi:hypothetical protein
VKGADVLQARAMLPEWNDTVKQLLRVRYLDDKQVYPAQFRFYIIWCAGCKPSGPDPTAYRTTPITSGQCRMIAALWEALCGRTSRQPESVSTYGYLY